MRQPIRPRSLASAAFTPPLGAGIRASESTVGWFPAYGALTVYNPGGAAPSGWFWDGNALRPIAANATLDLAQINGSVYCDKADPVVTRCKVVVPADELYGVTLTGSTNGTLTIEDTTVIGSLAGTNPQVDGISSDAGLVARRNHLTQSGDGIHFVQRNGTLVSQNYVGPLRFSDEGQHCDAGQGFQDTADGSFAYEHNYVEHTQSTIGTPFNSSLTMGPPSATGALYTPTIDNNYFGGGLYHLRFNFQCRSAVVTNNDFGPVHSGEFGYHDFDPLNGNTYATWSNNRDEGGNLIAEP